MKRVRDNDQPALIDMVETNNGKYICIWNMAGWWYKLSEYDDVTQTHTPVGKTYGSLEEAKAAAEEFATGGMVSDSRKIKDENTMNVLDGHLALSFKEGTEEETYKAIQGHANESGELDGVQYETYEVGEQDGVAIIDMCAATDDPNNFVKALLKEWGVIDNIADMKFQASEEMKEAAQEEEVSDSLKGALIKLAIKKLAPKVGKMAAKAVTAYLAGLGLEKILSESNDEKEVYTTEDGEELEVSYDEEGKLKEVSDSKKVADKTVLSKSADPTATNTIGVAFKYKGKYRLNKEDVEELDEVVKNWSKEKFGEVIFDSRRIKDNEVNIEDAVYDAIMEASPAVQDAIVEIVRDNYDLSEFESTEDLSNTIWNDIDYLASQLPEDLREDFADTYGF